MNGRRVLLVLLAMMLFSFAASAQAVKASFGVTGGGVATLMSDTQPATSSPVYLNGYGGAFMTMKFGRAISIRGGANYMMQGATYDLSGVSMEAEQTYINVPVSLLLNVKSGMAFELGFYQNILWDSSLTEYGNRVEEIIPDEGALQFNYGALAGVTFNMGRFVFLNFRYHYGLTNSYVIYGKGYPSNFATVGLGFNIINTRKKAF